MRLACDGAILAAAAISFYIKEISRALHNELRQLSIKISHVIVARFPLKLASCEKYARATCSKGSF
jgi:hypothetical protein